MSYKHIFWEFGTKAKASSTQVNTVDLTAANFTAQETLMQAFATAIEAVSLGNSGAQDATIEVTDVGRNPSLNPVAQRENKWLVSMTDNVNGNPFSFTIPCYDPSLLAADGSSMDATAPEYAALITATQDYVRSPAGNTGTVTSITFRTRQVSPD